MRRDILDAAKQLFVKEGFENVSMRRLASAIGYSPAAIYRYFSNKREILTALRDEGFSQYAIRQQELADTVTDPVERLRQSGRGYIRFAMEQPDSYHLMFSTAAHEVDLKGDKAGNSLTSFNLFRKNVQECLDTGVFGDVDFETAVYAFWSGVHGLAELIHSGRFAVLAESDDLDRLIDNILGFIQRPTAGRQ